VPNVQQTAQFTESRGTGQRGIDNDLVTEGKSFPQCASAYNSGRTHYDYAWQIGRREGCGNGRRVPQTVDGCRYLNLFTADVVVRSERHPALRGNAGRQNVITILKADDNEAAGMLANEGNENAAERLGIFLIIRETDQSHRACPQDTTAFLTGPGCRRVRSDFDMFRLA
jgi:hypothetical protein